MKICITALTALVFLSSCMELVRQWKKCYVEGKIWLPLVLQNSPAYEI